MREANSIAVISWLQAVLSTFHAEVCSEDSSDHVSVLAGTMGDFTFWINLSLSPKLI